MAMGYFTGVPFPLFLLYGILTCSVGFQIARILYYRHNYISFQFGFLLLCFVWGLMRSCFWGLFYVISDPWTWQASILQSYPVNLQFATFSLLVLFFVHLVNRSNGARDLHKAYVISYVVINIILVILQSVWLGFDIHYISEPPLWLEQTQVSFAAVVFTILVAILAWYGWQVHVAMKTSKILLQMQLPPQLFVVAVVIFILFCSRCIFDVANAAGYWNIFLDSDDSKDQYFIFLAYFFWEILPTVLIVILFWKIPTTNIGGLSRRGRGSVFYLPSGNPGQNVFPKNPHSSSGLGSRLFSESGIDDEATGFLSKGSPSSYTQSPYTAHSFGKNTPYATTPINTENNK